MANWGGCRAKTNKQTGHSYIYVSKDVRIRGYFLNPEGVREQNNLGKTALKNK